MSAPTLHEALAARGYTTRPAQRLGAKEILEGERVVFVGTAPEVWLWIRHQDAARLFERDLSEGSPLALESTAAIVAALRCEPGSTERWTALPEQTRLWILAWLLDANAETDWVLSCLRAAYELLEALP